MLKHSLTYLTKWIEESLETYREHRNTQKWQAEMRAEEQEHQEWLRTASPEELRRIAKIFGTTPEKIQQEREKAEQVVTLLFEAYQVTNNPEEFSREVQRRLSEEEK